MSDGKNFLILIIIIVITAFLIFNATKYVEKVDSNNIENVSTNKENIEEKKEDSNSNDEDTTEVKEDNILIEKTFISDNEEIKYLLYIPDNVSENMPLVVYLHGGSFKGNDLSILTKDSFPKYLENVEITLNAYAIIPQLDDKYTGWIEIADTLKELITSCLSEYDIDSKKVSLTGYSMGGTGAFNIAIKYSNLFNKIAILSGTMSNTSSNINALKDKEIWAFVGNKDTTVKPESSKKFIETLKKENDKAKITIYEDATHEEIPELVYKDSEVLEWLTT